MEALWLTVGFLFGVCFSAIGLSFCQFKRLAAYEQTIRDLKEQVDYQGNAQRIIEKG